MKKLITIVITLFLFAGIAQAMTVTLQWKSNTEPNVVSYKIYYSTEPGAPGENYTGTRATEGPSPITVTLAQDENPGSTFVEFTLTGLADVGTRFAVTAVDNWTFESGFSNEVRTGLEPPGDLKISFFERLAAIFDRIREALASRQDKGKGPHHRL